MLEVREAGYILSLFFVWAPVGNVEIRQGGRGECLFNILVQASDFSSYAL